MALTLLSTFVAKHGNTKAAELLDQPPTTINEQSKGERKNFTPYVAKEGNRWELYLKKKRRSEL